MARTGRRAAVLRRILTEAGLWPLAGQPPRPTGAKHRDELLDLYRTLGGLIREPVWRPGGWDILFEGPLVVELDEQLHFNGYRAATLNTSWSEDLPWTDAYRAYCAEHEARCLRDGCSQQRWTNASCARHFSGGPPGDRPSRRAALEAARLLRHAQGHSARRRSRAGDHARGDRRHRRRPVARQRTRGAR